MEQKTQLVFKGPAKEIKTYFDDLAQRYETIENYMGENPIKLTKDELMTHWTEESGLGWL